MLGVCVALGTLLGSAGNTSAQALGTGVQLGSSGQQDTPRNPDETTLPRRPYRGLFQGANDRDSAPSLVFNADLFGAYDQNVLAGGQQRPRPTPPGLQMDGYFTGGSVGLTYTRNGLRNSLALDGSVGARYYFSLDRTDQIASQSLTWGSQVGRYTHLTVAQGFMYTPNYRFNLFPGADGADDPDAGADTNTDFDLFRRQAFRNRLGVDLSKTIGPRGTFTVGGSFRTVNFVDESARDFQTWAANVLYQYRMTQNLGLRLGYGYRQAHGGTDEASARGVQQIDAGVDYGRALSFSRRTTLSFSTGTGLLMSDPTRTGADLRSRLRATGSVQISHEIARSWTANAAYHRGFLFREGFNEPFMSDAVSAAINGLIARRLDFNAGINYAHASRRVGSSYTASAASAQLRYGFTRNLAAYARYNYYNYDFADGSDFDEDFYPQGARHGYRVGLNAFVPLKR